MFQIDTLFMLFYRLPVVCSSEKGPIKFEFSDFPLTTALRAAAARRGGKVLFVGTLGVPVPEEQREEVRAKLDCVPVFAPENILTSHYAYCKLIIWPAFHSVRGSRTILEYSVRVVHFTVFMDPIT